VKQVDTSFPSGHVQRMPASLCAIQYPVSHPASSHAAVAHDLHARCQTTAIFAIRSLHAELMLYPKPGLVSPWDNGSHDDMDAELFMRSLFSLRHYFIRMTQAGAQDAAFHVLRALGIEAERRMLSATRGVNTHRGAIFALGLLCAAAGYCHAHHLALSPQTIRDTLTRQWGEALVAHSVTSDGASHGLRVAAKHAVGGAREEAAKGFPSIFDVALLQLHRTLSAGRTTTEAQIDAFFALMAHMNDTNVYHRGGVNGAMRVRQAARQFLSAGGTAHPDWHAHALDCHRQFVQARLSPGGAADLFAATWFVHQLTQSIAHDERNVDG
jgi:triphosphoribosyl-dephospho-CoA synthase